MPGASVTTITSFPTSAGSGTDPDGQLFIGSNGDLFGATVHGGVANGGIGTTYEIGKIGGAFAATPTYLADIPTGLNTLAGPNGNVPNLSADANGDLFGLMLTGGANTLGAVVEFPAGGGNPVTLPTTFSGGAGGSHPGGRLLVDASGNLFGTTLSGGTNNAGTVFEIQKTGNTYATAPITLASFGSGITPSGLGNLVEDAAGDLIGTTTSSVFEVKKTGGAYAPPVSLVPFPVGTQIGTLTIDAEGDIFGTTITGGEADDGTVFEIVKTATGYAGTKTTLASFNATDGQLNLNHPKALIVDANGDLFGTTDPSNQSGGNTGGVVYEIVKTSIGYEGAPVIVVNFQGSTTGSLGANLVVDGSGDLFGTQTGGASNAGTAFEITGSGFATTPSPLPPPTSVSSDFNFDGHSDLLFQNTSGQLAIWEMVGLTPVNQQGISPNPGPNWKAVGTGDFNADGHADILWQNTSGQVAIWEMNGTNPIAQVALSLNPGPNWHAVGTGDFNGDGMSDILWHNTNGQVAIWEMNGLNPLAQVVLSLNPGPNWNAIGTGDFNGDGKSDILWQNTNGQVAIWEMNGLTPIDQQVLSLNPGPAWQVIGAADFNGDGKSDILFQNTNGQIGIWEMNGTTPLAQEALSFNPGPSWKAIGTGDYYGDGHSDILFQNTASSQTAIWEMNGLTPLSQEVVSAIPGAGWQAIKAG